MSINIPTSAIGELPLSPTRRAFIEQSILGCKTACESLNWSTRWPTYTRPSYNPSWKALSKCRGDPNWKASFFSFLVSSDLIFFRYCEYHDLQLKKLVLWEIFMIFFTHQSLLIHQGHTMKRVQTTTPRWEAWRRKSSRWRPRCSRPKRPTTKLCRISRQYQMRSTSCARIKSWADSITMRWVWRLFKFALKLIIFVVVPGGIAREIEQ